MVLVLSLLLLGLLVAFLSPSLRATLKASARVELEQQALVLSNRIGSDLVHTVAGALTLDVSPSTARFGLVPYRDVDVDGSLLWDTSLVVYGWDSSTQQVQRKLWQLGQPPTLAFQPQVEHPVPPLAEDLPKVLQAAGLPQQVLAREVTGLQIALQGRQVDVVIDLARSGNEPQSFELRRSFGLRSTP